MFQELYKKLNKAQKEAVDAVEGPVMVVAGPGTGKTQILTLRIANILQKTQVGPENILALTFTESGVTSMRRRLTEMIGTPAYTVTINTFHGFCNDIIKNHPEEFPRVVGSQSITEVDQITIIEKAIIELPLKTLKPFGDPLYYARTILASINDLKREGLSPEEFNSIVSKEQKDFESTDGIYHEKGAHKGKMKGEFQKLLKQINKNEELATVFQYYESHLKSFKLYDYSDMIMEVLRELRTNPDLLLILQEQYQYILVDEHQDTNNGQNKILELLCNFHSNPNIFVVGDEKQAIFRFQGALLENFKYFQTLYPSAKLIVLEENYRSTQNILDAAHALLAGNKPLRSNSDHQAKPVSLYVFSKPDVEYYFIAQDIAKKLALGTNPREIAVLYRDNKDALPIAHMLEKLNLPFGIESDQDILADTEIKKLMLLFWAVANFGQDESLLNALHIDFLNLDPLDLYQIAQEAYRKRVSAFEVFRSVQPELYGQFSKWTTLSKNISLPELFERIIKESGFLDHLLGQPDAVEKLEKLNDLFDEVKKLIEAHKEYDLEDFLNYVSTLEQHNLLIKRKVSGHMAGVRLMTAHKSKGQEFEYVYIINTYDGHWGNKRHGNLLPLPSGISSMSGATNDDERRLFYVALTRAKKEVSISYAKENLAKEEQLPCQFISEIKPELIDIQNPEEIESDFLKHRDIIFRPIEPRIIDLKSKDFIKELFSKNGLSVTALNNYLECPWKYFYRNLIRIPEAKSKHQMYGTAIHNALKDFFDGKQKTKDALLKSFIHYIEHEPLKDSDLKECIAKGQKSLSGWFTEYNGLWPKSSLTEFAVNGIMLTSEVRITGKIDKIELINGTEVNLHTKRAEVALQLENTARSGVQVNVVDYKTSKPKTRGEIEGTTKNSNGDVKRQLVFYNLLLNKEGKYKMISGDIDFTEPDEKGKYHKEKFHIQPEEVRDLEKLVIQSAKEILSLSFWDKTCNTKDCEFCALRKLMN